MNTTFSAEDRKGWMSLLATADEARLTELWQDCGANPVCEFLRAPEAGGVMVRGRMGGSGAPFNLGEMTVTRCALSLEDGTVGHGYVQGRSKAKAEIAAKVDALMQTAAAGVLRDAVLAPLAAERQVQKDLRAAKAAATKVEFFTMVRGED
ncbi:phosphonate C-P lyase system protein PhnG [Leisingera sp. ANG-Vp]|uniref:phosphonate C-P lyase system protein PhnG n=1 Tax=Leisingera sp. ANG-Vp TaxID=1577896 RepID=UPI00057E0655|nr:phosphonate C-P lyase system protein PhnG [Leisingera sp. ANG-Vp]KIC20272.1 phosphonate metabolism protein PhnG [Leisingera sp. ANG-Vp]